MKTVKLLTLVAGIALVFAVAAVSTASAATFSKNLTVGSRGADVSNLQQVLIDGGYLTIDAPTMYFGAMTKKALMAYQKENGLPSTGYFGPMTREVLNGAGGTTTTTTTSTVPGCAAGALFSSTTGAACGTTTTTTTTTGTGTTMSMDGTDGSISVSTSAVVSSSQTLKKGDVNKPITAAHIITTSGNVTISRLDVNFNTRPWLVFGKLTLKDGTGKVLATKTLSGPSDATEVTVGSSYNVRFDNINFVTNPNMPVDLVVTADVLSASDKITGQTVAVQIQGNAIRTINGKGYTDSQPGTALTANSVVLSSTGSIGDLYTRISPNTPDTATVGISSTSVTPGVTLGVFDVKLMNNPGTINSMTFNVNNSSSIASTLIFQNPQLTDGVNTYGAASFSAANPGVIVFSNLNLPIASTDTWKSLTLKADAVASSTSVTASSTLVAASTVGTDANFNTITLTNASNRTANDMTLLPNAGVSVSNITSSKGNVVTATNSSVWGVAYPSISFTLNNTGNSPIYISKLAGLALATTTTAGANGSSTVTSVIASGSTTGDTSTAYIVNGSRTFTFNYTVDNTNGTNAQKKLTITQINYGTGSADGTAASQNAQYNINYGLQSAYVQVP